MVVLLDLPNEILDIILKRVVRDVGPLMRSQPSCYSSGLDKFKIVLPLRLVCSLFRDLADLFIFQSVACLAMYVPHTRDAGLSKSGLFQLLATNPVIGGYVRALTLEGQHGESALPSALLLERLEKALRHTHSNVEQIRFERDDEYGAISDIFYTNVFVQGFPHLRTLLLADSAFALCLLDILPSAPLLEDVTLCGLTTQTTLSYSAVQTLIANAKPSPGIRGTASNSLRSLRVLEFGKEWLCCLLANAQIHAVAISIEATRRPWTSTLKLQLAVFEHLKEGDALKFLAIRHLDVYYDAEQEGLDPEEAGEIIHEYMENSAPQRATLFSSLTSEWAGMGVHMGIATPMDDWPDYAWEEGVTIGSLLNMVWEKS
jgi:hypothetical protein